MNEQELRNEYEAKLQNWKDAESAYAEGGTDQQRKDMNSAEDIHDWAAWELRTNGYSLTGKEA